MNSECTLFQSDSILYKCNFIDGITIIIGSCFLLQEFVMNISYALISTNSIVFINRAMKLHLLIQFNGKNIR